MIEQVKRFRRKLYHLLNRYPIYRVLAQLKKKGVLQDIIALEAFAYTGSLQAVAYHRYTKYHEAWEIKQECETQLKKNLPRAVVKITDSFQEIKRVEKKFNFVLADTHQGLFGDGHCEHFDFLPMLFRALCDEATIILNVIPKAGSEWIKRYGSSFSEEHLQRRRAFYGVQNAENIEPENMMRTYHQICNANGYTINWYFFEKRHLMYFLTLRVKKRL